MPDRNDSPPPLVDVAVVMAREMKAHDESHPDEVLARRLEAAARLIRNGFTEAEARLLYDLREDMPIPKEDIVKQRETQASVVAWTDEHYPDEKGNIHKKMRNLVEEVGELSSELGFDPQEMAAHFLKSAMRPARGGSPTDPKGAAGEIGDVRLGVYDLSDAMGVDADDCLDAKMDVNREKTPDESRERQARKTAMGL